MAFYSTQRAVSDGTLVLLPISIEYFDRSEITVYFDDLLVDEGFGWSWVGSTDKTLAFSPAVLDGVEVKVVRTTDISLVRHVFVDGAAFLDETLDENYKQMLHIAQEARERASIADMFSDLNMHGYPIINVGTATEPHHAISLAQYQADALGALTAKNQAVAAKDAAVVAQVAAETAQDFAEAAANSTQVVTVSNNITNVNTVAGNISNVNTVAGISTNVTTVANKAAEVTTVAGSISNVNTVAGSIANVNTVAMNQTSVNTVAADIAAVQTVAADLNEPVSEIETVAGNITNVNTVGNNISSVNTCATNIAAIIDAPTQAAAAAASAAAAAASYDSFDDRYLGSKSTAPTVDNDGNALVQGALYYNNGTVVSGDKGMWVYDGSQWIQASAASQAILTVYKFIATAGQTTFSGTDSEGKTLSYTPGSVIITLNGPVITVPGDVVASSGTAVVLTSAAVLNDEVNVYAFSTFNVADTYSQAQTNALLANKLDSANGSVTPEKLSPGAPSWNSSGNLSFNSGYGSVATTYGCRAWVNFNGTGTVAIRASGNVSSITDNGTGTYKVNFTNAMPDDNYSPVAIGDFTLGVDGLPIVAINSDGTNGSKTTSGFGITTFVPSFSLSDIQGVFVAIIR